MNTHADKTSGTKSQMFTHEPMQRQREDKPSEQFVDARPEAIAQRRLQALMQNSGGALQRQSQEAMAASQRAPTANPIQRAENKTGLPDNLKTGMESLSGLSLDHVKVHYNSSRPATVQAHAYAQGSEIHLASGQEQHLPHELGHVVQQMQGRVQPTTSIGAMQINDNPALENEATALGDRALQRVNINSASSSRAVQLLAKPSTLQLKAFSTSLLNVAGEDHDESNLRRGREQYVTQWVTGGGYWTEPEFQVTAAGQQVDADPSILRFQRNLQVLRRLWNTLIGFRLPAQYVPNHAHQQWLITAPIIALVGREYAASVGDRYSGGAALSVPQGQQRDQINQVRHAHFASAAQALQGLNALHPYDRSQKATVEQLLIQFKDSAVAMAANVMEMKQLDGLRSTAMHNAAVARSTAVGVWKIGQAHVDDIKRDLPESELTYNLMTQEEFNDEYSRLDLMEVPD